MKIHSSLIYIFYLFLFIMKNNTPFGFEIFRITLNQWLFWSYKQQGKLITDLCSKFLYFHLKKLDLSKKCCKFGKTFFYIFWCNDCWLFGPGSTVSLILKKMITIIRCVRRTWEFVSLFYPVWHTQKRGRIALLWCRVNFDYLLRFDQIQW